MLRKILLFILIIFCFSWSFSFSEEQLPQSDKNGDYGNRTTHIYWKVVDPDPEGLNGRLADDFPADWEDIRASWPETNVAQWPVVTKFSTGSILTACPGNCGIIFLKDKNGKSWLMVYRDPVKKSKVCFVRANVKYIKPVRGK